METEIIDFERCPMTPWRNGAGSARLVATHPPESTIDDFEWRISVASVVSDSLFSCFPGTERCVALLRGNGMQLLSQNGLVNHRLDQFLAPFYFLGGVAVENGV